jgi:hypothetical protein
VKVILFNGEDIPTKGDTFVVKKVYRIEDGVYGPQVAVVLEALTPKDINVDLLKQRYNND